MLPGSMTTRDDLVRHQLNSSLFEDGELGIFILVNCRAYIGSNFPRHWRRSCISLYQMSSGGEIQQGLVDETRYSSKPCNIPALSTQHIFAAIEDGKRYYFRVSSARTFCLTIPTSPTLMMVSRSNASKQSFTQPDPTHPSISRKSQCKMFTDDTTNPNSATLWLGILQSGVLSRR